MLDGYLGALSLRCEDPLSQTTCRATIIADDPRRSVKNEKKSTLN